MKKLIALVLALVMVMSLGACTVSNSDPSTAPAGDTTPTTSGADETVASGAPVNISLWTYPVGDWGKQEVVDKLLADFNAKYPDIKVTVEYLTTPTVTTRSTPPSRATLLPTSFWKDPSVW